MVCRTSVLVNKVKGQIKAINLLKHAFREVKILDKNIFKSKTEFNFYWINDQLCNDNDQNKSKLIKNLLMNKIEVVKKQFEENMLVTKLSRQKTWQNFCESKNLMQEVLVNISPNWWEQQKFVSYHEELFYDKKQANVDKVKWGIKEIFNSENLKTWGESQIEWIKQELKDTYGNDNIF